MISIIIPLYNKEAYIANTLESVINQDFIDFEIIIIDDGSTDHSVDIIRTYKDSRIKLIHQENGGVSSARNHGIEEASGEYITFLDADDIWRPNYLREMDMLTKKYPSYFVFCSAQVNRKINCLPDGVTIINDHCLYDYIYSTGCILIHRDVLKKTGLFRIGISLGEDRDMWLRIACYYPTIYLNEETTSHPPKTEVNLSNIDPAKSFPYWEWYEYPYQPRKSLYRYATQQIIDCAVRLVEKKQYKEAFHWLNRCKGWSSIRARIKLYVIIMTRLLYVDI